MVVKWEFLFVCLFGEDENTAAMGRGGSQMFYIKYSTYISSSKCAQTDKSH